MKKVITEVIDRGYYVPEGDLIEIIKYLANDVIQFRKRGYRNVGYYYSTRSEENILTGDRDETDAEYEKRIEAEKAQQVLVKANALKEQEQREARKKYEAEREKNLYLELKKKYEGTP